MMHMIKIIDYNTKNHDPKKYKFIHLDFCDKKEEIENADLCIIKDVIQHWPLKYIYDFLDYLILNKKFKYVLITNCCYQKEDNTDIMSGQFRPLNSAFYPLRKYSTRPIYYYASKEVSVLTDKKYII